MPKTNDIIVCPHCGYEYLPGEIYLPKCLVGQPKKVLKNSQGKIMTYEGTSPDLKEKYYCDNCNKEFSVEATFVFKTSEVKDIFEELFTTTLK